MVDWDVVFEIDEDRVLDMGINIPTTQSGSMSDSFAVGGYEHVNLVFDPTMSLTKVDVTVYGAYDTFNWFKIAEKDYDLDYSNERFCFAFTMGRDGVPFVDYMCFMVESRGMYFQIDCDIRIRQKKVLHFDPDKLLKYIAEKRLRGEQL